MKPIKDIGDKLLRSRNGITNFYDPDVASKDEFKNSDEAIVFDLDERRELVRRVYADAANKYCPFATWELTDIDDYIKEQGL